MDIRQFARALQSKDLSRDTRWFADHIQLYTPIHKEPIVGREAVTQVLQLVFSIFENFHYPDVVPGAVWLSCPDLSDKRRRESNRRRGLPADARFDEVMP